ALMRVKGQVPSNKVDDTIATFRRALVGVVTLLRRSNGRLMQTVVQEYVADGENLRSVFAPRCDHLRIKGVCEILRYVLEKEARIVACGSGSIEEQGDESRYEPGLSPHRREPERCPWRYDPRRRAAVHRNEPDFQDRFHQIIAVAV